MLALAMAFCWTSRPRTTQPPKTQKDRPLPRRKWPVSQILATRRGSAATVIAAALTALFLAAATLSFALLATLGDAGLLVEATPLQLTADALTPDLSLQTRSEERRVGKECWTGWSPGWLSAKTA